MAENLDVVTKTYDLVLWLLPQVHQDVQWTGGLVEQAPDLRHAVDWGEIGKS